MSRVIERVILGIVVVLMAIEGFFGYSAYSAVQAQTARISALEAKLDRELATVKAEAEARVKRIEDDVARIRRP